MPVRTSRSRSRSRSRSANRLPELVNHRAGAAAGYQVVRRAGISAAATVSGLRVVRPSTAAARARRWSAAMRTRVGLPERGRPSGQATPVDAAAHAFYYEKESIPVSKGENDAGGFAHHDDRTPRRQD
jgi:hypothetical protein